MLKRRGGCCDKGASKCCDENSIPGASYDESESKQANSEVPCRDSRNCATVAGDCCAGSSATRANKNGCTTGSVALDPADKTNTGCSSTESSCSVPKISTVTATEEIESTACVDKCCETVDDFNPQKDSSACSNHLRVALDRFEALIKQSKCICRSVVGQMGVSCCSLSPDGRLIGEGSGPSAQAPEKGVITTSVEQNSCNKGCCDQKPSNESELDQLGQVNVGKAAPASCCDNTGTLHADNATSEKLHSLVNVSQAQQRRDDNERDAAREHITISISGMTCTGCSTKMTNVLNEIPGVTKPQVTFVSGTAKFEVNSDIASVDQVLPLIEKRTGFKCSRVVEGYQHLDVHMSTDLATQMERDVTCSEGLISLDFMGKAYRITYNPYIIGARDLLPENARLAPPSPDSSILEGRRRLVRTAWYTAIAAAFTIPVVVLNWAPNPVPRQTRDVVSLILATVVQAIAVPEFYVGAMKSLIFSKVIEMDMLVVISITAAYVYSVVAFGLTEAGVQLEQHAFFETSTLLITLVLLGRLLAAYARERAVRAVSVRSLQAEETLLLTEGGGTTSIDARLLQFGDIIVIKAHSRIVTDGTVTFGTSAVDESMLTGESLPVGKKKGNNLIAGTLNGEGVLHARINRLPGANSVNDIARSVEQALEAKPRIQDLADKIASRFVPAVVAIATLVFAVWIGVALRIRGQSPGGAIGTAVNYAIAVLAVSCPCALGLAVPMVLVIAGGVAARAGVVIKSAEATERSCKATDVVFDKTGTLTTGHLTVASDQVLDTSVDPNEAYAILQALVKDDNHPVSRAVATHLTGKTLQPVELNEKRSIPGSGIEAKYKGQTVCAGNPHWLNQSTHPAITPLLSQGLTTLLLTINHHPILATSLTSTLRPEAHSVIAALQARGITCHIASGDHSLAVSQIATALSIPPSNTLSHATPQQKQAYISALQSTSADNDKKKEKRTILFVGDGTNDAPALAASTIGIQLGTTSSVAGSVADVVLLSGLSGVLTLLEVSGRARRRIMFNFAWAAVYNVFAILLAAGAFVRVRIEPAYAGLGEIVSVGPVVAAAVSMVVWGGRERAGRR